MKPGRAYRGNLPEVVVNMAMTSDGAVATAGREVTSFGGSRDLRGLYALRAGADAVICGARTVEETRATLGNGGERYRRLRERAGLSPHPLRVVVSGSASFRSDAVIWEHRFSPIVILARKDAPVAGVRRLRELTDHVWITGGGEIDFASAFRRLSREYGVRRLVCEGGGKLNAALFAADLVDEIRLTLCPLLFGGSAAPSIADAPEPVALADMTRFRPVARVRHGDTLFLRFSRVGR